jgi:hypothetical protein
MKIVFYFFSRRVEWVYSPENTQTLVDNGVEFEVIKGAPSA